MRRRSGAFLAAVLACLVALVPTIRGLTCYRCTVLPTYDGEPNQPCAKFDGSSRFYVECPQSTFCMKRVIPYLLPNGTLAKTAERNCAYQKDLIQDYNYNDRQWYKKEIIDTKVYDEGCFRGENRGTPNGPSEYCYCSSNYCNKSTTMADPLQKCSLLVIAVFLFLGFS